MNIHLTILANNVISITPDEIGDDPNGSKWLNSKKHIANKILGNTGSTTVVVSKGELSNILTDACNEFRHLLSNDVEEFLVKTHNFLTHQIKFENTNYTVTCIYNAPTSLIDDLIESDEFTWGNLYLICCRNIVTQLDDQILADLNELLSKSTFMEMPSIKCELLASTSDGCEVLWFNPSTDISEIL